MEGGGMRSVIGMASHRMFAAVDGGAPLDLLVHVLQRVGNRHGARGAAAPGEARLSLA